MLYWRYVLCWFGYYSKMWNQCNCKTSVFYYWAFHYEYLNTASLKELLLSGRRLLANIKVRLVILWALLSNLVCIDFRVVVGTLPKTDVPAVCEALERTEPQGGPSGVFTVLRRSSGGLEHYSSCLGGNSGPSAADIGEQNGTSTATHKQCAPNPILVSIHSLKLGTTFKHLYTISE